MNLPPVPGSSLPPPPPPPPAPPPPLPPPTPTAGAPQLSRRTLLWIGGGLAALLAVVIIAARLEAPTESAVKSFARSQFVQKGFDVDNIWVNRLPQTDGSVAYRVHCTYRRSAEARYEALLPEIMLTPVESTASVGGVGGGVPGMGYAPPDVALPDWLPLDLPLWRRVRAQLASPNGLRLRRAAGLSPEDEALAAVTVVRELKESAGAGNVYSETSEDTVRAERHGLAWSFSIEGRSFLAEANNTSRRRLSAFRGKVLVLDRAEDRSALLNLAQRLPAIGEKLDGAVGILMAEMKSRWLNQLKPQALFAGTVETQAFGEKRKAAVYLEITETRFSEDPPRLSALLRNDGGWLETRLFAGRIAYDDDTGGFLLKLTSPSSQTGHGAGPFLDDNSPGFNMPTDEDGDRVLPLILEEGGLVWKSGATTLRLEPVRQDAREALIASLQGDQLKLLEATRAGQAYLGVITSRAKGTREPWLLRFTTQDDDASEEEGTLALSARLEHTEKSILKCTLRGRVVANRYRTNDLPLRLQRNYDSAETPPKEVTDIFEARDNNDPSEENGPEISLRLDGKRLIGENSRFAFQFEPATPEQVSGIEKKWAAAAEAERRLIQDATRPGLIYRGTITAKPENRREDFLLRFVPTETGESTINAYIEHPDHPTWRRLLVSPSATRLGHSETDYPLKFLFRGGALNGEEMRKLSFLDSSHEEMHLRPDGSALEGSNSAYYKFRFVQASPEAVAQWQQRDTAIRARILAFIQPGSIHNGLVEVQGDKTGQLQLRFLKAENNGAQVEALLQSRLHPQYSWRMTGRYDPDQYRLTLNRTGTPGDAAMALNFDPDLEPLLRYFGGQLDLFWDEETMSGYTGHSPGGWRFRFQPSSPEQAAMQQREEAERAARLLAFVQPAARHDGTVTRIGSNDSGLLRLRILKMENRGERVEAVLYSRPRPYHQQRLTGSCDFLAGTLRLQWQSNPSPPARPLRADPDLRPFFRNYGSANDPLILSLEQNQASGSLQNLTFRFEPSSSVRLNELVQEENDRSARALTFVQGNTAHEGTMERAGGVTGRVRLRILSLENSGERIIARLESVQQPQYAQRLTGQLLLDGALLQMRLDRVPADQSGFMLFDEPSLQKMFPSGFYDYNDFELTFTADAVEGSFANSSTRISFPLR